MWKDLALADAPRAITLYENNRYFTEDQGDSRANILYWLYTLKSLGHVDPSVTADTPTAVAFRLADERTHVAYNPGPATVKVTFSDGASFDVGSGRTEVSRAPVARRAPTNVATAETQGSTGQR